MRRSIEISTGIPLRERFRVQEIEGIELKVKIGSGVSLDRGMNLASTDI